MNDKYCSKCDQVKGISEFYFVKKLNREYTYCKECCVATNSKRQKERYVPKPKPTSKVCNLCHVEKPISLYKRSNGRHYSYCPPCRADLAKHYYESSYTRTSDRNFTPHKERTHLHCPDCDTTQDVSNFYWNESFKKYGSYCKPCQKIRNKNNYQKYHSRLTEIRHSQKDERRMYAREYYQKNLEEKREKSVDYYYENREKILVKNAKWRLDNPEEFAASKAVCNAVRRGEIIPPEICECCLQKPIRAKKRPIEFHHLDYSRPLDGGLWLCRSCHKRYHADDKEIVAKCDSLWSNKLKDISFNKEEK